MDQLFEGFAKERIYTINSQIDELLNDLVEKEIYPKIIEYILSKIEESVTKEYKIHYINTHITGLPDGIFKEIDLPNIVTLDGKEFNVPLRLKYKYRSLIINQFIEDYQNKSEDLIEFNYDFFEKYYTNTRSKQILSEEQYEKLHRSAKSYYKVKKFAIYVFKFHLEPKNE